VAGLFTSEDTWLGSFYELAIELGPRSDKRLAQASEALWRHQSIDGPYAKKDIEPADQPKVAPSLIVGSNDHAPHLRGVATLPGGFEVACGSVAVREEESQIDWFDFYIPWGALETVYEIDYDAYQTGHFETWRQWAEPLDAWFAEIGRTIYKEVPFALALIGEEASGMTYASEVAARGGPGEKDFPMLFPDDAGALNWYPRTNP
jgi:hypothetical protein